VKVLKIDWLTQKNLKHTMRCSDALIDNMGLFYD